MTQDPELGDNITKVDGIIYVHTQRAWNYILAMRKDRTNISLKIRKMYCHMLVLKPPSAVTVNSHSRGSGAYGSPLQPYPTKIDITNEYLKENLDSIDYGFFESYTHGYPFWAFVRYESHIRANHLKMEEEFKDLSLKNPTHPAVLRRIRFIPGDLDDDASYYPSSLPDVDKIFKARVVRDGLWAIVRFLDTDLHSLCLVARRMEQGLISDIHEMPFEHLWYLFKPGELIVSEFPKLQAFRTKNIVASGGRLGTTVTVPEPFSQKWDLVIDGVILDFDGNEFGPSRHRVTIHQYDGLIPVINLPVYPLAFASKGLRESLIKRGRKFQKLAKPSHCRYRGLSLKEGEAFDTVREVS